MKKRNIIVVCIVLLLSCCLLTACYGDKKYLEKVDSYGFWDNKSSEAIAQPNIGARVEEFLKTPSVDNKKKKVAFIGYDGCRADALINALDTPDEIGGHNDTSTYSGIAKVLKDERAGIYIAYAGGEKGKDNEQHPSTAPGWAALTTGVWGIKNGITDNGMQKNIEYKTFMLKAALGEFGDPMKSVFAASWNPHFTENYTDEIEFLRQKSNGVAKQELSEDSSIEEVNAYLDAIASSCTVPMNYHMVSDDKELHEYLLSCVEVGNPNEKDVIFGIYEATDHNGHSSDFGNHNYKYIKGFRDEDERCYELIEAIYNRPTFEEEDWLIIITADHGGIETWHGGQTLEERTTWVVCNQGMDSKCYSKNYDGYVVKG